MRKEGTIRRLRRLACSPTARMTDSRDVFKATGRSAPAGEGKMESKAVYAAIRWEKRARHVFAGHMLMWAYYVLRSDQPFHSEGRPEAVRKG